MSRVRPTTLSTWISQLNSVDAHIIPIETGRDDCYDVLFKKTIVGDIYTISVSRDIYMSAIRNDVISTIIHVNISGNNYRYIYFYIYDKDVICNIGRWVNNIDISIGYCICIKTIDPDTARMCVFGYAMKKTYVSHSSWRDSLRCTDMRAEHATSDIYDGIGMIHGEVIIDGPYIRDI